MLALFWGRGYSGLGGGMKMHLFASVHLSVCLYWAGAQIPYLELLGEGVREKFSTLVSRDFGRTKFGQKNEVCMLYVSGRKWCQKIVGI